jgi:subtilisin family serine protease
MKKYSKLLIYGITLIAFALGSAQLFAAPAPTAAPNISPAATKTGPGFWAPKGSYRKISPILNTDYVEGVVLVKFREGKDPQDTLRRNGLTVGAQDMEPIHSRKAEARRFKKALKGKKNLAGTYDIQGKKYQNIDQIPDDELFQAAYQEMTPARKGLYRKYKINLLKNVKVEQAVRQLKADPDVEQVFPNYLRKVNAIPNDARFSEQWALSKINAVGAWDVSEGRGVVVAVIDTGVDYTHEDLAANIWINSGEDLNKNGKVDPRV